MSETPPVLILAGGKGSRLRSAVRDIPKPLALVGGKPFLQHYIDHLVRSGIYKIVVSAGYKAEFFDDFLAKQDQSLQSELLIEPDLLGTGGAILFSLEESSLLAEVGGFFCVNGDSFVNWDPVEFANSSVSCDGGIVSVGVDQPERFGTLTVNESNRLMSFNEKDDKPSSNLINAGVYYLNHELFGNRRVSKCSLEYDLFPFWLKDGRQFQVHHAAGPFIDIGTPESYAEAQTFFSS